MYIPLCILTCVNLKTGVILLVLRAYVSFCMLCMEMHKHSTVCDSVVQQSYIHVPIGEIYMKNHTTSTLHCSGLTMDLLTDSYIDRTHLKTHT